MKTVNILGISGSVGEQAVNVVRKCDRKAGGIRVGVIAAHKNAERLARLAIELKAHTAAIADTKAYGELKRLLKDHPTKATTEVSLTATSPADVVVVASSGISALKPLLLALKHQTGVVAVANKEAFLVAGRLVMEVARASKARLIPLDSEHNAIYRILATALPHPSFNSSANPDGNPDGNPSASPDTNSSDNPSASPDTNTSAKPTANPSNTPSGLGGVRKLILTASGGAFYGFSHAQLAKVTPAQATSHPHWNMGAKITVDSATLMNKGAELIEASYLFSTPLEAMEVLVQRGSLIHSVVEFSDGTSVAQISPPSMEIPLGYAICYPEPFEFDEPPVDLETADFGFKKPDEKTFTAIALARQAHQRGEYATCAFAAADEAAVAAFLENRIGFLDIVDVVAKIVATMPRGKSINSVGDAEDCYFEAFSKTQEFMASFSGDSSVGSSVGSSGVSSTGSSVGSGTLATKKRLAV